MGRPRKRSKEAVLFRDEEETQNCRKCGEHFDTLPALRSHKMSAHSEFNGRWSSNEAAAAVLVAACSFSLASFVCR